ncbi:6171_t:CDS:2 [Funneliformis geosporum]|uniref:6171_t:CDS:1 n=1 Tax=Funneliformis geosporum TaxID=1117311 RepID=A0A9W4SQ87_9GLOM|nr:6171_t:CDS:2 [Funneliformis geosporum]
MDMVAAAALSKITNTQVITYNEYLSQKETNPDQTFQYFDCINFANICEFLIYRDAIFICHLTVKEMNDRNPKLNIKFFKCVGWMRWYRFRAITLPRFIYDGIWNRSLPYLPYQSTVTVIDFGNITKSGRKAFDIPKLKKWLEDEREYRKKYGSVGLEPSDVTLIMMYLARTYPPTNMESRRQDCLLFPPVIDTISPHIKKAFPIQSKYLNEMLTHLNWMKTLKPMYRENGKSKCQGIQKIRKGWNHQHRLMIREGYY